MLVGLMLIALAVLANWGAPLMLFLSSIVAATFLAPVDAIGLTQTQFYAVCIAIELVAALLAYGIGCARPALMDRLASYGVATLAMFMAACHVLVYHYGYNPTSPYTWLMISLEYLQLLCCVTFSRLAVEIYEWTIRKLRYNNAYFLRSRHGSRSN